MEISEIIKRKNWTIDKAFYFFLNPKIIIDEYDKNHESYLMNPDLWKIKKEDFFSYLFKIRPVKITESKIKMCEACDEFKIKDFDLVKVFKDKKSLYEKREIAALEYANSFENKTHKPYDLSLHNEMHQYSLKIFYCHEFLEARKLKLFSDGSYKRLDGKDFVGLAGVFLNEKDELVAQVVGHGKLQSDFELEAIMMNMTVASFFGLKNIEILTDSIAEYHVIDSLKNGFFSKRFHQNFEAYQFIKKCMQEDSHNIHFIHRESNQYCDVLSKSFFLEHEKNRVNSNYFSHDLVFKDNHSEDCAGVTNVAFRIDNEVNPYIVEKLVFYRLHNHHLQEVSTIDSQYIKNASLSLLKLKSDTEIESFSNLFDKNQWCQEVLSIPFLISQSSCVHIHNPQLSAILMNKKEMNEDYSECLKFVGDYLNQNGKKLTWKLSKLNKELMAQWLEQKIDTRKYKP